MEGRLWRSGKGQGERTISLYHTDRVLLEKYSGAPKRRTASLPERFGV